jgi:Zn-finger nucleic acid-binding protein
MPAQAPCPKCRGQFVELDRGGIKIDVCQECRGVFLDRGELDQIIAAEKREVANVYSEDESFFRQLAGQQAAPPAQPTPQPVAQPTPQPVSQPAPPVQPPQPAYTPPPAQPTYTQPPAQPAYSPPPPSHSAPPPQPAYGQQGHGHHGHGTHQQYGFDLRTAERLLGDFRQHQSSHKKKHQKSLLQQLFD